MSDEIVNAILIQGSISKLEKTILQVERENKKIQQSVLYLTIATVVFAIAQVFIALLQLFFD